jgi:hypothetical protein
MNMRNHLICPACAAPLPPAVKRRGRACWYCYAPLNAEDPPALLPAGSGPINPERPLSIGPSKVAGQQLGG